MHRAQWRPVARNKYAMQATGGAALATRCPPVVTYAHAGTSARGRGGQGCYLLDEERPGDEAWSAPERVVDVGAERLQLRGEAAVDHRAPARSRHELLHRAHLRPPVHAHLRMARRQPMERDLAST